jgi:hypothetical protein
MTFWIYNPSILFDSNYISQIWPYSNLERDEKLNAMTRFIILITLIGYMCINRFLIVILGLILIGLIVIFYQSKKEGFEPFYKLQPYFSINEDKDKKIENNNPFSNVLMTDYKYNVNKEESNEDYTPALEEKINDSTKQSIIEQNIDNADFNTAFDNDNSNIIFEQSMRSFYTNPITTIPNKQDNFLEFCYGKLPSEKPLTIY